MTGLNLGGRAHPSITCPDCFRTSYHPVDVKQGYCAYCHDWTSPPAGAPADEFAAQRAVLLAARHPTGPDPGPAPSL